MRKAAPSAAPEARTQRHPNVTRLRLRITATMLPPARSGSGSFLGAVRRTIQRTKTDMAAIAQNMYRHGNIASMTTARTGARN